jgi:hypothetical protein
MQPDIKQNPSDAQILGMCDLAVKLFGTDEDPTQADPNLENSKALISVDPHSYVYAEEDGHTMGWSCVLPTSKRNMELFLSGKITEKQLFEYSMANHSFEELYLIAAIVLPEYRKKGLASCMMESQILYFKKAHGISDLYAFTLTEDGKGLIGKIEKDLHTNIRQVSRV